MFVLTRTHIWKKMDSVIVCNGERTGKEGTADGRTGKAQKARAAAGRRPQQGICSSRAEPADPVRSLSAAVLRAAAPAAAAAARTVLAAAAAVRAAAAVPAVYV